ncbi:MAG: glycosyltransferase family 87 protein [Zetaproteobacteria bacterium]|nr:glycosyltransferase family 87 protein [Zetaproteobacteria bacterium]
MHETSTRVITRRVAFFAYVICCGCLIAQLFHFIQGYFFAHSYPWNTYLFKPIERFGDWSEIIAASATQDPYFAYRRQSSYFPFTYLLLQPITTLAKEWHVPIYFGVASILYSIAIPSLVQSQLKMSRRHLLVLSGALLSILLFSYPFQFAADRGNIDLWIFAIIMIFVASQNSPWLWPASILLGGTVALKIYPLAMILLPLKQRRLGCICVIVGTAMGLSWYSLQVLGTGEITRNLEGLARGLAAFRHWYIKEMVGLAFFVDPYNFIRVLMPLISGENYGYDRDFLLQNYKYFSFSLTCLLSVYALWITTCTWRTVTAIGCIMLIFPYISSDYKILALLPGIFLYLTRTEQTHTRGQKMIHGCFILLLIPKHYYFFAHQTSLSVLVSAPLLLILIASLLWEPDAWKARYQQLLLWSRSGLQQKIKNLKNAVTLG